MLTHTYASNLAEIIKSSDVVFDPELSTITEDYIIAVFQIKTDNNPAKLYGYPSVKYEYHSATANPNELACPLYRVSIRFAKCVEINIPDPVVLKLLQDKIDDYVRVNYIHL